MPPSILINRSICLRLSKHLRRAGKREIGGLLFGEQLAPGKFRLVDFSVDAAMGQAAHFSRSVSRHSKELERFFERTCGDYARYNYLGEWHSHPCFAVIPSAQDYESMLDMVRTETSIPFSALLIARLDFFLFLRLGATMFSRHRDPEIIQIERH